MLIVHDLTKNLLSVSKLIEDNNVYMEFLPKDYNVKTFQGQTILQGDVNEGLYRLPHNQSNGFEKIIIQNFMIKSLIRRFIVEMGSDGMIV